ncbi:YheT family hydrolase [Spirochaetota bacterium]
MDNKFNPPFYLRGTQAQTILASSKLRKIGKNRMVECGGDMIIDAGDGVRLLGYFSPQKNDSARGLVIMLNGWEGSHESAYMVSTGRYLYEKGYSLFRLNFKDHGDSYHLNEGLFYATLIDEVYNAICAAAELSRNKPVFLVGFSMGGNFALRVAMRHSAKKIGNLKGVYCISPLMDPEKSTDLLDNSFMMRKYFLKKWRRSLVKKQELYPHLYNFDDVINLETCRIITDRLIPRYSEYGSSTEYFKEYTIKPASLSKIDVPMHIVTSEDDPIIPVEDFYNLKSSTAVTLIIHKYGGHNGFIENIKLDAWYEREMISFFEQ